MEVLRKIIITIAILSRKRHTLMVEVGARFRTADTKHRT